jgi:hypothetical protein
MNKRHPFAAHDSMGRKLSRRAALRANLGALGACLLGSSQALADAQSDGFVVIVNPQNPLTTTSREFLGDIFLKKISRWEDGEIAHPVDLSPNSPVRRAFSSTVIGRSVAAVRHYWQQRIFSGRDVPPAEFDADDAVVRYVAKYRGAVGYVAPTANLTGSKLLRLR